MLEYIAAIQKKLVTQYKFAPRPDCKWIPAHVPDGRYPMKINGRVDNVEIRDGKIHCCNFR